LFALRKIGQGESMTLTQSTLDFTKPITRREKFEAFHEANPHVYENLEELAFKLVNRGVKRFGISLLYENLRWHFLMTTAGDSFKLNNSYRSHYARLLIENHPEWADRLEIRELRSA
jgi:hypothetical protein